MTAADLAARLDAKRNGAGWQAKCPAHEDTTPSLSISEGREGVLLHCHAGCSIDAVCSALGIAKRDLFAETNTRDILATYDYTDVDGTVLYQVVRFAPKDFRQRKPDKVGGWEWNLNGVRRVLYRLPDVVAAVRDGKQVWVCEGEKDADALRAKGRVATCNSGGAGKWRREYGADLKGADVVIVADKDKAGRAHAHDVFTALYGVAKRVRVVEAAEGKDASDHFAAGRKVRDFHEIDLPAPDPDVHDDDEQPVHGEVTPKPSSTGSVNSVSEEWEAPAAFRRFDLPAFPVEVFPPWLGDYVQSLAHATQTPLDLAASMSLAAIAVAVAGKVEIAGGPGYVEPLNLFWVAALPPGNRKSAVFQDVAAPIQAYEAEQADACKMAIAKAQSQRQILETRLKQAQTDAAKAPPDERSILGAQADAIAQELAKSRVPVAPRWLADDATQESLSSLLYDQGGRMGVLSPEGDVFDIMAGRYAANNTVNIGVYLRGHAGDPIRIDRKGRGSEHVRRPSLTIGLAVQPDVLRGLVTRPGFRGRGLLGRFLYSLPDSFLGRRATDAAPVPDSVRTSYAANLTALLALPEKRDDGQLVAYQLQLHPTARREHLAFQTWIEPHLGPDGSLGTISDWAGKLGGAVLRLAGLLHVARYASHRAPWEIPVGAETVAAARRIADYLLPHARAAFGEMGEDPQVEGAKYLLERIELAGLDSFSERDGFRLTQGRFQQMAEFRVAVRLLADHGYIRERTPEPRVGAGRPKSPVYDLNPLGRRDGPRTQLATPYATMDRIDEMPSAASPPPGSVNCVNNVLGEGPTRTCSKGHALIAGLCPECDRAAFLAALDAEAKGASA